MDIRAGERPSLKTSLEETERCLLEWAWGHGVARDMPCRPAFCAGSGCRGMVATRAIAEGEVILSIPDHILMSADSAVQCSVVRALLLRANLAGEQLCERQVLSAHLLLERHKGASSKWCAFLSSLPMAYDTVEYWTDEDVASLQHIPLLKMARMRRAMIRQEFSQLRGLLREDGTAGCSGSGDGEIDELSEVLSWEAYRWAAATVSTRSCHYVPTSTLARGLHGEKVGTLVPVLDMLNHSPQSLVASCALSDAELPRDRSYQVKALHAYQTGDEIFIHYGPWPNSGLLQHYGFILPGNPMDVCQVYLPAPKTLTPFLPSSVQTQMPTHARKKAKKTAKNPQDCACREEPGEATGGAVREKVDEVYTVLVALGKSIEPCGASRSLSCAAVRSPCSSSLGAEEMRAAADGCQEFELYSQTQVDPSSPDGVCAACDDEEIPWNVMTVMRWNAMVDELQAASARGDDATCARCEQMAARVLEADDGSPLSAENEVLTLANLLRCLEKILDSFPTSFKHDVQLLKEADLTRSQRLAVDIRAGQKRILIVHIRSLRQRVALVSAPDKR